MHFHWNTVANERIGDLEAFFGAKAKRLGEVTLNDLAIAPAESCGIYLFFDESDLAYVGKCSSRAFIERIPAHLDARSDAWFGTLIQKLATTLPDLSRDEILRRALRLRLALISVDENGDREQTGDVITVLEMNMRHALRPTLNTPRVPREFPPGAPAALLAQPAA